MITARRYLQHRGRGESAREDGIKRFRSGFTPTSDVCRVNKSSLAVLQPRCSHARAFIWWASSIFNPHFTNRRNPPRRAGDTNRCKCIDSPVTGDSGKVWRLIREIDGLVNGKKNKLMKVFERPEASVESLSQPVLPPHFLLRGSFSMQQIAEVKGRETRKFVPIFLLVN